MKRIFGILALLSVVALTATATGYASEATLVEPPPIAIQTVEVESPALTGTPLEGGLLGWDAGLAVNYTCQNGMSNLGLQVVAAKTLTPLLGWRCTASVNGLLHRVGFDRYATALAGPVVNFSPLYAFLQVGAVLNPSTQCKISPAANTGAGVAFDVGKRSRIFAEAAIDAVPAGGKWISTLSAGIGYAVRL